MKHLVGRGQATAQRKLDLAVVDEQPIVITVAQAASFF
jgi:hypothetical protein